MPTLLLALLAAPPQVGDVAADFELSSVEGEAVSLRNLRSSGPVVLVILRGYPGYQCPLCTRQVGQFLGQAEQFAAANADLVFVYPTDASLGVEGTRQKAREFLKTTTLPANAVLLLDPGYELTSRYDLRWNAANETAYPSTFVIDREGIVISATVSKSHGGRASASEILRVVRTIAK